MQCINTECHSHRSDNTCSITHLFTDRLCSERKLPSEPEPQEESEE